MGTTDTERYLPRLDHSYSDGESRPHLGAVLLRSKLLRPDQLDDALAKQAETGKRLGEVLVEDGLLFPQDIARALAIQFGFDYVDICHVSVDPKAAACLDPEIGQRLSAIPVRFHDGGTKLIVGVADPTSEGLAEVQNAITLPVVYAVTESADIRHAWRMLLQGYRP